MRSINGVNSLNSTAREGNSNTFIEFEIGTDPNDAVAEVKNAVDTVRGSLPDGILEPRVTKEEISGGFLAIYAVEADDMTIEGLSWFIDDSVAKQLLSIEGMAEVNRFGGVDRETEDDKAGDDDDPAAIRTPFLETVVFVGIEVDRDRIALLGHYT